VIRYTDVAILIQAQVLAETLQSGLSEAIVGQLSNRFGFLQIAEDGQSKYFGATSNLHIISNNPLPEYHVLGNSKQSGAQPDDNRPQSSNSPISRELEDHLISLYFTWEAPLIRCVDKDLFLKEREESKNVTSTEPNVSSSELLVCAM